MTEVKVKQIKDPKTKVRLRLAKPNGTRSRTISDGFTRIKEIKASIVSTPKVPVLAQVEVTDIWKNN